MELLRFLFLYDVTARMIQRLHQLRAVEHCMFEAGIERNRIVRASCDTELAEHARTEVVLVLCQYLLFLAVFSLYHFTRHRDGIVGACHLAQPARYAAMLVLVVMRHGQRTTEAIEHLQCRTVLGILLRHLPAAEDGHGSFHTRQQGADAMHQSAQITICFALIFHYLFIFNLSEGESCPGATPVRRENLLRRYVG